LFVLTGLSFIAFQNIVQSHSRSLTCNSYFTYKCSCLENGER